MSRIAILRWASALCIAALAPTVARAQSSFDLATFSCQDWLDASDDEQDMMLVWLRGYAGGRTGSTLYNPNAPRFDRGRMQVYCRSHPTVGLVSAIGQLPP